MSTGGEQNGVEDVDQSERHDTSSAAQLEPVQPRHQHGLVAFDVPTFDNASPATDIAQPVPASPKNIRGPIGSSGVPGEPPAPDLSDADVAGALGGGGQGIL